MAVTVMMLSKVVLGPIRCKVAMVMI